MEMCKDLSDLTLDVKEDQNEVFRLFEIIKPAWKKDQVNIKSLSGGYSCSMLQCSHDSGEAVTVRVRNTFDGIKDPAIERRVVKTLSSKGYFPPLLAVFQNGFCYEFIPGKTFATQDSKEINIQEIQLRLIAEQMANFHSLVIPEFDYSKTSYFDNLAEILSTSKPLFEESPSMDEFIKELRMLEDFASKTNSPLVLCHGDLHPANMVWDEEQNKMSFVDWESTTIAPRGSDIARTILSPDYLGDFFIIPVTKPADYTRKYCQYYLERWNELHELQSPTTQDVDNLLLEYKYHSLTIKLAWIIYMIKFSKVFADFSKNIESLWEFNYGGYLRLKGEVLGMNTLGLPSN